MERPIVELLAQLQAHPILCYLTLDGITTFVRLITHLKRDILQPQPINESNPTNAPTVLPQPVAIFLGKALSILVEVMDDCWTILRGYAWEMPTMPLMQEDYDLFKQWGWQCGLSEQSMHLWISLLHLMDFIYVAAMSIYPIDDCCPNIYCDNRIPLKKEYRKKAVVFTQGAGVQPAWNMSLYCQSRSYFWEQAHTQWPHAQGVTRVITRITAFVTVNGHILLEFQN